MKDYGKLSKRNVDDLKSGARIEVGEKKEDPLDFALWKGSPEPEPGWESPWGRGRPGWHIECSAMSMKYLGETLDFHGGGEDLIFPHHENEIAQSECATGHTFVQHWLHNGLLNLKGEKMSKSTGHFFAMEDVLKEFSGEVVRFYLLSTHFRSQTEFSRERLEDARKGFERLTNACRHIDESLRALGDLAEIVPFEAQDLINVTATAKHRFLEAMDDDMFDLVKQYNSAHPDVYRSRPALEAVKATLMEFDRILGLFHDGFPTAGEEVPADILKMVEERQSARKDKDFQRADAVRDRLAAAGLILEDTPAGVRVKRK
jgi:cysteinyl-tRNA synthetase